MEKREMYKRNINNYNHVKNEEHRLRRRKPD